MKASCCEEVDEVCVPAPGAVEGAVHEKQGVWVLTAELAPFDHFEPGNVSLHSPCSILMNCAARSPITTHGAMVLPLVIRGIIEASAIRTFSMP